MTRGGGRRELTTAPFDTGDFLEDCLIFWRILPFFVPVETLAIFALSTLDCCLEDEFRKVLGRWAVNVTVCKVFDHGTAVLADRTKVESVPTTVEGEAIKDTVSSYYKLCIFSAAYIMSNSWIRIEEG